jgi:hypothetical protein
MHFLFQVIAFAFALPAMSDYVTRCQSISELSAAFAWNDVAVHSLRGLLGDKMLAVPWYLFLSYRTRCFVLFGFTCVFWLAPWLAVVI